ncbi:MAG: hypothetical protein EON93_23125 [Burkholderiales bacterium]|nr:MAG: hypothetical protein EON93_23125 [Burkholderiales bacterium]
MFAERDLDERLPRLPLSVHFPALEHSDDLITRTREHVLDVGEAVPVRIEDGQHIGPDVLIETAEVEEVEVAATVPASPNEQGDAWDLPAVSRFGEVEKTLQRFYTSLMNRARAAHERLMLSHVGLPLGTGDDALATAHVAGL